MIILFRCIHEGFSDKRNSVLEDIFNSSSSVEVEVRFEKTQKIPRQAILFFPFAIEWNCECVIGLYYLLSAHTRMS